MHFTKLAVALALTSSLASVVNAEESVYERFPITVQSHASDVSYSESYKGQIARHLLHNALKKLAVKGNGQPNPALEAQMMAYLKGTEDSRSILDPVGKEGFPVAQKTIEALSASANLSDKAYKGTITSWPGNLTGPEVLEFLVKKAASSNSGFDPVHGYDYAQLISKFAMGAVFYNQAVDGYLDEKLESDVKPNNEPYSEGAPYTGKEHVWDEAFGYFGAPVHALTLDNDALYGIVKQDSKYFSDGDFNKDGEIDLYSEMLYAHAYYAVATDRVGKTQYFQNIMQAFLDGRWLISEAKGQQLTETQRSQLKGFANTIANNWQKVIAEATFKYAGEVYKDLEKIQLVVESNGDVSKVYRDYVKHWGELKGFSMALQLGRGQLGETESRLNRLIGFSPVLLGDTQVVGIDAKGNYIQGASESMVEYRLHMMKVQRLMVEAFDIKARQHDVLAGMDALAEKLGSGHSSEND